MRINALIYCSIFFNFISLSEGKNLREQWAMGFEYIPSAGCGWYIVVFIKNWINWIIGFVNFL